MDFPTKYRSSYGTPFLHFDSSVGINILTCSQHKDIHYFRENLSLYYDVLLYKDHAVVEIFNEFFHTNIAFTLGREHKEEK